MNIQAISNAIIKRRKMLSVSQKELADLAGVSLHSIINLESGKGNPTLQLLLTVLEVLGMEVQLAVKDVLSQTGDSDD
jgi:y4mF family transcriptional regulator